MEHLIGFEGLGIEPFTVDSVAFSIGGFNIYWYAIIITVGLILAVVFAMWQAPKFDLTSDHILDVLLFGLPAAVICARAYYVLFTLDQYDSFADVINIRNGGLAIYGGIIGAFAVGIIYSKVKKINFLALFDIAALGFLIGQAVGRWGNFMNAEAHGGVTDLPWGMTIDSFGPYHPTFFYESLWNTVGFFLLLLFAKKWKKNHGEVFFLYLSWYGFGRFFIEGLRTDSLYLGSVRISQLLALVFFAVGLVLFLLSRRNVLLRISKKTEVRKEKKAAEYVPLYTPLLEESTEKSQNKNPELLKGETEELPSDISREMEEDNNG